MRRIVTLSVLALTVLGGPVPASAAGAKARGCFSEAEARAEMTVRHGLFLREAAKLCEEAGLTPGIGAQWADVDKRFGRDFKLNTDLRRAAFAREFDKRAPTTQLVWDGRLVMLQRHAPVTQGQCNDAKRMLQEIQKGGFKVFSKQAAKDNDDVVLDYKVCK